MPNFEYDKDYPFAAFITNLGKYNEGELVGKWVQFPTTAEEMKKAFDSIGIGQTDDFGQPYEEWFITDYDCYVDGLYDKLGEYESLDELNYLASKLDNMTQWEYEQFQAAMELGSHSGSVQEIINLTENLDCYDVYPDIFDYEDLGRYYIEEFDTLQVPEYLCNYIDYESYGRDVAMEENGEFTSIGYVRDTRDSFREFYDGERGSIPEEYRVMTFQNNIPEEELSEWTMDIAFDMDEFFRQHDPQYAAEHMDTHAAKEKIYEDLTEGRISALEEKLKALGQTETDHLPSELEKYKEASGYDDFLDVDPAAIRAALENPDKSHVEEMLAAAVRAEQEYRAELFGQEPKNVNTFSITGEPLEQGIDGDEPMITASMELAGDIDLFFRQYDMEYATMFPDDTIQQMVLHEHLYKGDTSAVKTGLINASRESGLAEEATPLIERLDSYEKEYGINTYMVYQLQGGDKTRNLRFEPLDSIKAMGHTVDRANYELVYAAPFTPGKTLEAIYQDLNMNRPNNFHGHFLSVSDIVVLHQNGKDTAHYCDRFGFSPVPEFLTPEWVKESIAALPEIMATQQRVHTPRGNFCVSDVSKEQMEAAGYGYHHSSEDGKYLIMGNGTIAYAIPAEQWEKENPLRTAEMTLEDDYGMIDGVINNGRRGEEQEKAKPSIRERLEEAKRECAERKPPEKSCPARKAPEHGEL